jgi:nucleotide-binding universal stress UspA family protein
MYRTIMVGLDGSASDEQAVSCALALKRSGETRLLLARAVLTPADAAGAAVSLGDLRRRLGDPPEVAAEILVGRMSEVIAAAAGRRQVDLLVLADGAPDVVGEVARSAGVPVLLVPGAAARPWPAARPPRVLVPLDGSRLAREVLPSALALATVLEAELLLLHVIIPPGYASADLTAYVPYNPSADRESARAWLEEAAAAVRRLGGKARTRTAVGLPTPTIVEEVDRCGADVVALSTHGYGGALDRLMGSVAVGVIQRCRVPVLVVRPERAVRGCAPGAIGRSSSGEADLDRAVG